jgi:hypothetical protein
MPTHQGQTQTDIVIGDGGDSASEHTSFEFNSTYSASGGLQVVDLAPGTDRQYSAYELVIQDPATGLQLATFAARYKAWIDVGSATGKKEIDITNKFDPGPVGSSPNWPLAFQTSAERTWRTDTFDRKGNLYARAWATWSVRTTVASTSAYVIQTIVDQTPTLLRVHLVYLDGSAVVLDTIASMGADVAVEGGVAKDPPDITDSFVP